MDAQNLSGQKLGQYELREQLGAGGMGAVYRAFQPGLNRIVAVKVLSGSLVKRPGYLERFTREAQTAASLEHSHIVPVYDYGTQDDVSYIVMRLLSGGSLSDRLDEATDKGEFLPLSEIANILNQLGGALDYAHGRGVVHRDIKPGNIMFDQVNAAFLVDFGIAKIVDGAQLTTTGMTVGTPAYMSPEQWRGEMVTSASDQYALGAVIFNLVAGRLPFEAPTPFALMHKHVSETLPPINSFRPDVPEAISAVLTRAMAKSADDRFPSVGAFAKAFAAEIEAAPNKDARQVAPSRIAAAPENDNPDTVIKPRSTPAPPLAPRASRSILPIVGGLGAVALIVVAGFFLLRPAAPTPAATSTRTPQPIAALSTNPPATQAPPTLAPPTQVPPTNVPPTVAPTLAPPTRVPPTIAPTVAPTRLPTLPPTVAQSAPQSTAISATIITTALPAATRAVLPLTNTPAPTNTPNSDSAILPTAAVAGHIVFASGRDAQNVLMAAKANGSGQRRIGDDTYVQLGVTVSPDGKQIAYVSKKSGKTTLYIANADGSNPRTVQTGEFNSYWIRPRWLGDTIFFDEYDAVYFVNTQTNAIERRQIAGLDSLNWGADNNTLLIATNTDKDGLQIYRLDLKTNATTKLSDGTAADEQPALSPDGKSIAFYSKGDKRMGLFVMDADGKNIRKLSGARDYDYAPTWSPDGKRIAYVSYADDGGQQVYVMNADGSNPKALTKSTSGVIGTLAWSGDSTEVYYRAGDNNIEIYLMNADGSNPRRVTNSQQDDFAPALSPDGKQIVFSASGTLALINADGSGLRLLPEVFGVEPNWSPDGAKIVFSGLASDSSGRPLTIVNADGSGLKVISDPKGFYDGWASFSPDGKQIVFYSNRDGRGKIFVMNADGTNRRQLTTDEGDENYPAWSPDGKQIMYVNRNADPFGIYVMDADGSNRKLVSEASFPLKELSWSSDDRVLFTSEEAGNSDLYVLNLKDKKITRLTNLPSSDEFGKFGR